MQGSITLDAVRTQQAEGAHLLRAKVQFLRGKRLRRFIEGQRLIQRTHVLIIIFICPLDSIPRFRFV